MEFQIVQFFNQLGRGSILDNITIWFSYIPFLIILWLALAIILIYVDKKDGKVIFFSIVFAVLIYFLVNDFFFKTILVDNMGIRLRPYLAHPGEIIALGTRFADSSFPSGHVASSVAVLSIISYFYRKAWPVCLAFVLFMMFARMHMGMHYPSDVLAGAGLGLIYSALGIWISKKILKKTLK